MCAFQLCFSVDSSLGRVDYSLMSDQTLMEMLLDGFDNETKKEYQDNDGMYLSVCKWQTIKCDDDERVIEITVNSGRVSGSLELCYVPPKVKVVNISVWWGNGKLTGSVDFACLPEGMQLIDLRNNNHTGEIDLTRMPEGMQRLYIYSNKFTGEIDLTQLPRGMHSLLLFNNQLTGELDLTQLPDEMYELSLNGNQFSGEVDLTHLPAEMYQLFLYNNQLSGSLIISRLPRKISVIDVRVNQFCASAVVDSEAHATIKFHGSGVTSVVDENGKELDMDRFKC